MASSITLSAGVRANLLSLQKTAGLMSTTQTRLATGKKVNTALDNPVNFFTSSSLQSRSSDLSALLDSMSNGIKTLEAADNGLTSITSTLQSMKSTLSQARQDKSFQTAAYTTDATTIGTSSIKNLSFSGGAVGSTAVNVPLKDTSAATAGSASITFGAGGTLPDAGDSLNFTVTADGGTAQNISITGADVAGVGDNNATLTASEFRTLLASKVTGVTVGGTGSTITLTSNTTGTTSDVDIGAATLTDADTDATITATAAGLNAAINGTAGGAAGAGAGTPKTVDQLVAAINANSSLSGKVSASNDGGKLRIQNLSTADLTVTGARDRKSVV